MKNKTINYLLALYCVLLPFEEALANSLGSILRIVGFLLIGYILLICAKNQKIVLYKYYIPLFLWMLYMIASILWSDSIQWWSYFTRIYLVQVIFLYSTETVPIEIFDIELMKKALIIGSVLASSIMTFFPTASGLTDEGRRTIMLFGTMLDPNIIASIILIGIHITLEMFYEAKKHSFMFLGIMAWQFFGMLLTGSRGALIAFAIGFIIGLFLKLSNKKERKKALFLAIFGTIAIMLTIGILPENLLETRFSKETILGINELKSHSHNRYTIWGYAFNLIKNNPVIGYGCGNFFSAIATLYKTCAAHNLYILLIVEGGIIGFSTFIIFILKLIKDLLKMKEYSTLSLLLSILVMALSLDTITYKYFWIVLIYVRLTIRKHKYEEEKTK